MTDSDPLGSSPPSDPLAWKRVVEQTFRRLQPTDDMNPRDVAALAEVARKRRGEPFVLVPVATELVAAILKDDFRPVIANASGWDGLVHDVASAIFDDAVSRARMENLWSRLLEGNP